MEWGMARASPQPHSVWLIFDGLHSQLDSAIPQARLQLGSGARVSSLWHADYVILLFQTLPELQAHLDWTETRTVPDIPCPSSLAQRACRQPHPRPTGIVFKPTAKLQLNKVLRQAESNIQPVCRTFILPRTSLARGCAFTGRCPGLLHERDDMANFPKPCFTACWTNSNSLIVAYD